MTGFRAESELSGVMLVKGLVKRQCPNANLERNSGEVSRRFTFGSTPFLHTAPFLVLRHPAGHETIPTLIF